ncbi:MAG: HNH endonuclease [Kiritimatiellaeota bacterium]|nr:HNH endonuclease [Kiritimatiellota bacterium]
MSAGKKWTRDELLILLNIYHKLEFGQFDHRNKVVKAVAQVLRRTPSSVAMKLSNLASFDPVLKLRGIAGLPGASKLDAEMWNEFTSSPTENVATSEELLHSVFEATANETVEVSAREGIRKTPRTFAPPSITETVTNIKQRRGQDYFRSVVLNNYGEQCAISRIPVREFLIASHILPWATHPEHRLDVCNGICLSRLHDAAFDLGLVTFDEGLRLRLSGKLSSLLSEQKLLEQNFGAFEGECLFMPDHGQPPSQMFLSWHRENIFVK